mmetsp:Transcript_18620/g.44858  ORF Transcript_18620/g.44858 Transcript_18620/m.44858 type:complete len:111 (-) Transcript_18620:828-1160(-)
MDVAGAGGAMLDPGADIGVKGRRRGRSGDGVRCSDVLERVIGVRWRWGVTDEELRVTLGGVTCMGTLLDRTIRGRISFPLFPLDNSAATLSETSAHIANHSSDGRNPLTQ